MATTTNFGWETPDDTDLVKDGAAAIRTALNGVDTSFADLKGGTTGQVLSKASGTDLDFTWVAQDDSNAIQNAIMDAKGDLIAATAADTPARLAVGTNGHVLTADSAEATGIKWAAPAGASDLVRITTASFTTSSAVNVDSCFSSTYDNYLILLNVTSSAAGTSSINVRFRSGGTTDTTSNYSSGWRYNEFGASATTGLLGSAAASNLSYIHDITSGATSTNMTVYNPNAAFKTMATFQVAQSNYYHDSGALLFNATTAFDGISFIPGAGSITGTISVYGYKKA